MLFVDNGDCYDAATNIALETYLVENRLVDEPILLFYMNKPSVIIGRNQNTIAEINQTYVDDNQIQIVRRMSGGGAVYHDLGNFSFCFIKDDDGSFRDFESVTKPIIDALHRMGVTGAKLEGRNDLLIDGKKFSGNAMYVKDGRMTAHGTILYDADLDEIHNALKPRREKIVSKGIKSVRSRVTNIRPYVSPEYQHLTTAEFRDQILLAIFGAKTRAEIPEYHLTDEDWAGVMKIREERMGNWDWNYGESPDFNITHSHKFDFGLVDMHLDVSHGHIQDVKIYGDFFGLRPIEEIESALSDVRYDRDAMIQALESVDLSHYVGPISVEAFIHQMMDSR